MKPELLQSQKELRDLSNKIVDNGPEGVHSWTVPSSILAGELVERLRASSVGVLLVPDGESLCVQPNGSNIDDIGLYAGQVLLAGAAVGATSLGRQQIGGQRKKDLEPQSWSNTVEIALEYAHPEIQSIRVFETLISETGSDKIGRIPTLGRTTYSPTYAEAGFIEHQKETYHVPEEELDVLEFLGIAREMYAGLPKREMVE